MNNINYFANKFIQNLDYNIDFNNIVNYFKLSGWKTVMFNTDDGDIILKELDLYEKSQNENGLLIIIFLIGICSKLYYMRQVI